MTSRQLAHKQARNGQFADAAQTLRTLLRQAPRNHELWLDLAHCYLEMGNLQKACQFFEKSLILCPEHDQAWFGYAITLEAMQDYTRSFEAYHTVLRLNPGCVPARQHLGGLYLVTHHYQKARDTFEALNQDRPTVTSLMGYALALDYMGQTQAAQQAYCDVLAYKPNTRHRHYIQERLTALVPRQARHKRRHLARIK
jgi:tetratricopeptide (TPR) repeat protein